MHILIGITLALGLLYFWLVGHWFARFIMFWPLALVGFCANLLVISWLTPNVNNAAMILAGAFGLVWGFGLTNLPRYWAAYRYRTQVLGISRETALTYFFDIF